MENDNQKYYLYFVIHIINKMSINTENKLISVNISLDLYYYDHEMENLVLQDHPDFHHHRIE